MVPLVTISTPVSRNLGTFLPCDTAIAVFTPGKPLNFALMQGNIAQEAKWEPKNIRPTLLRYLDMTRANQDAEIIIWPESAIPAFENDMREFLVNIDDQSADQGTYAAPAAGKHQERSW